MSVARLHVVTGCSFLQLCTSRLVVRFGTLGWLLASWFTMMRLLSPSSRSSRSTQASKQSLSLPAVHLHLVCTKFLCFFVWDVAKFATHDRCRKYVSGFDKVKIEGDKFKETKATATRPRAQTCSLLANRNSVVHFGGFRGQSRLDGSAHHAETRNLESPCQKQTLWSPPRRFHSKRLRGAGIVLARVLHESSVTRLLTPCLVGKTRQHLYMRVQRPDQCFLLPSGFEQARRKRTTGTVKVTSTVDKFEPN